jgi:hypothetical protein
MQKTHASEAPDPGRHHVGIPGDIIPESPGDFVGIRNAITLVLWATTGICRVPTMIPNTLHLGDVSAGRSSAGGASPHGGPKKVPGWAVIGKDE